MTHWLFIVLTKFLGTREHYGEFVFGSLLNVLLCEASQCNLDYHEG